MSQLEKTSRSYRGQVKGSNWIKWKLPIIFQSAMSSSIFRIGKNFTIRNLEVHCIKSQGPSIFNSVFISSAAPLQICKTCHTVQSVYVFRNATNWLKNTAETLPWFLNISNWAYWPDVVLKLLATQKTGSSQVVCLRAQSHTKRG